METDNFWVKAGKTTRYYAANFSRIVRGTRWKVAKPSVEKPIFVVGCSRAGTTLVYKTFSECRKLGSLQRETHDFWATLHPPSERNWDTHAIDPCMAAPQDRDFVARYFFVHTGKRRFVDKNNQNGLSIPYLRQLFPDAVFVYVKRSPGDNLHSLMEGWKRADEFATWSNTLPVEVAIEQGRFTRWCFFLAEGWRDYVNASLEEVCAFQYRTMNEAILEAKEQIPPDQWIDIVYEELLNDPVTGFADAFAKAGLSFDEHMRRHCATVLAKPYNAFSEIRASKWRDKENRERIESTLSDVADVAQRMGYEL
ncbi:sulfotransferase [Methylocaldum sp.]|uniref:sulfotransferase family protein n=1 Tax=Methylocaldum sp. TaxID=1969727 RepID=UPI002D34A112|nr:sulfotransferase [Methylocaldum sp.]HYE37072.1 sulfotransferase [Methylocaldum sp.]